MYAGIVARRARRPQQLRAGRQRRRAPASTCAIACERARGDDRRRPAPRRAARARRTGARTARGRVPAGGRSPVHALPRRLEVDVEPDHEVLGERVAHRLGPDRAAAEREHRARPPVEQLERDPLLGRAERRLAVLGEDRGRSACRAARSITASTSTASIPSASAALRAAVVLPAPMKPMQTIGAAGSRLALRTAPSDPLLVGAQRGADVVDVVAAELPPVGVGEHERDHRLADHAGGRAPCTSRSARAAPPRARAWRCRPSAAAWSASAAASSNRGRRAARRSSCRPPPRPRGSSRGSSRGRSS